MLVNLARILAPAVNSSYSVACFNVFGWEDARAVVDAAAQLGASVILAANMDFRLGTLRPRASAHQIRTD
jgi:fructose-bisphosphate aldolase, class II